MARIERSHLLERGGIDVVAEIWETGGRAILGLRKCGLALSSICMNHADAN